MTKTSDLPEKAPEGLRFMNNSIGTSNAVNLNPSCSIDRKDFGIPLSIVTP